MTSSPTTLQDGSCSSPQSSLKQIEFACFYANIRPQPTCPTSVMFPKLEASHHPGQQCGVGSPLLPSAFACSSPRHLPAFCLILQEPKHFPSVETAFFANRFFVAPRTVLPVRFLSAKVFNPLELCQFQPSLLLFSTHILETSFTSAKP